MLFTDVEGSTRLLYELGDDYAVALAEHRRILRGVMERYGGVEVDTQGDAFFYAFARASNAVAAAGTAQDALAAGDIRVRIGVHTGEPRLTEEGYVGLDVHTAARIAACAHGGQVVVSSRTRELLDADLVARDLGQHRLKDVVHPVRLFQLGAADFPPLRSLNATNLPEPVSSFIGRVAELRDASSMLSQTRLLTITGPGGVGKTRFAIALARDALERYPDGVWWVPLADLSDRRLVVASIERAVGASTDLAGYAAGKRMLILLDNFEHVIAAAPELSPILASCPGLTLLVTTREVLRLEGEREFPLAPLSGDDAAALFSQRAGLEPTEPVRELCTRLEALPLAIELAAARASLLSPAQILQRLSQRLDLFSGGRDVDPRHLTLRATIEWSHDLLTPEEQALLARFSVFAGGATFEAAETVVGAEPDGMQSLLDKSLIRRTGDRIWMLETIREYAAERLAESGGAAQVRERHARYFLAVAESANLSDWAPGEARYGVALTEQANFRAALGWTVAGGDAELGLRLATALENFWVVADPFEAMRWFDALLARSEDVSASVRAAALRTYGGVVNPTGNDELAERLYESSLAEYRRLGDDDGVAGVLVRLGHSAWYRGANDTALALGREGLDGSRRAGNTRSEAQALGLLGELEFERGEHDRGLELLHQSVAVAAACGFRWWEARMLLRAVKRARELDRQADALRWALESLGLAVVISDRRRIVQLLDILAAIAVDRGQVERAGRLRGAAEAELARAPVSAWTMTDLDVGAGRGEFERGRQVGLAMDLDAAATYALEANEQV